MGKLPNDPTYIPIPFAEKSSKNTLPENPASSTSNLASWNYGFPDITRKDKSDGGLPPSGKDFQGIFYSLSEHTYYQQSGGVYKWNANLNYPVGSIVLGSNNTWYRALKQSGPNISNVGAKNPVTSANSTYVFNDSSSSVYWQNIDLVYATTTRTGVVKIGTNINVTDGVISVNTANGSTLGLVKQGTNTTISNGTISVATANGSTLGLVKQGDYVTISNGVISANKANGTTPGVVYQGNYVTIANDGKISANLANGTTPGVVKQGSFITISNGTISVNKANGTATTDATSYGVVKQGNYITISNTGVISANKANGTTPGVVSQGTNVSISSTGVISVATANSTTLGLAKQGTNVTVSNGAISVADATTSVKGVVKLSSSTSSTVENLAATPKAVNSVYAACVHKSGDTMTGNLTIGKSGPYLCLKSTDIAKNTKPSSNYRPVAVEHLDKNSRRLWGIYYNYDTDKQSYVRLIVNKGTTTDNTWAGIGVGYDKSGNWFTYAPTPATADKSTKIATTEWVRTAVNAGINAATATTASKCTGNSATATKLATARTINGVSFDGTKNITIPTMVPKGTWSSRDFGTWNTDGPGFIWVYFNVTTSWNNIYFYFYDNGGTQRQYTLAHSYNGTSINQTTVIPIKKGLKWKVDGTGKTSCTLRFLAV